MEKYFMKGLHFVLKSRREWKGTSLAHGWWLPNAILNRILVKRVRVFGDPRRVYSHKSVVLDNALLNTISGNIYIGKNSFCGQNVSILTGSHDYNKFGAARQRPTEMRLHDVDKEIVR